MSIRILDVGQCGFDGPRLQSFFESRLQAEVQQAGTLKEARERLAGGKFDVVLVNRVLNEDGSSGVDVIAELAATAGAPPLMLVSDRPDAQDAAVAAGALRGFGKADLGDPATLDLIRAAAGGAAAGR